VSDAESWPEAASTGAGWRLQIRGTGL